MRTDSYGSVIRGPVSTRSKHVPERTGCGATEEFNNSPPVCKSQCTLANAQLTHIQLKVRNKKKKEMDKSQRKTAMLCMAGAAVPPALWASVKWIWESVFDWWSVPRWDLPLCGMSFCTQTIRVFRLLCICVWTAHMYLSFGAFSSSFNSGVCLPKERTKNQKLSCTSDNFTDKHSTHLGARRENDKLRGKERGEGARSH